MPEKRPYSEKTPPPKSRRRRHKKKKNVAGRVFLILLCLILLAFAAAALYYNSMLNRLDFADKSESLVSAGESLVSAGESLVEQVKADTESIKQAIQESGITGIQSVNPAQGEVKTNKNIVNVLLIGSDYRIPNTSDPGRADVTMLCSLNKKTGDIKLISFERGIMMDVPGVGIELLTHSFHYGGAELTTQLLRDYFLLDIAGYAHVDFDSFSALVNAVGGVDIELTDAEAWALGCRTGWNHMDGALALKYCRLRSIDSNWGRIARQRTTVQAILNQVKDMNLSELNSLAETILPLIHTDLSKAEITSILLNAPKFLGATAEQMVVPDHNNQNCDFQYETDRLRDFIYG